MPGPKQKYESSPRAPPPTYSTGIAHPIKSISQLSVFRNCIFLLCRYLLFVSYYNIDHSLLSLNILN